MTATEAHTAARFALYRLHFEACGEPKPTECSCELASAYVHMLAMTPDEPCNGESFLRASGVIEDAFAKIMRGAGDRAEDSPSPPQGATSPAGGPLAEDPTTRAAGEGRAQHERTGGSR